MDFNTQQRQALAASGRVLVSAAAGSGKTAVLVEKVVRLICDENNPIDIDKLLVVTYTNAAAAEMKARISKRLSEKLKENPKSFHLKKQKLLLSSANISTIDSQCIALVREYFYKTNISSDFKIADNSVVSKLENEAIDEVFAEKFEKGEEIFLDLVSVFGGEYGEDKLRENVFKIYEYLCSLPFPQVYIDKITNLYENADENSVFFDIVFEYAYGFVQSKYLSFQKSYEKLLEDEELLSRYGEAFLEVNAKLKRMLELLHSRDYDGVFEMLKYYSNASLKSIRNYSNVAFRDEMKAAKTEAEKTFKKLKDIFNCERKDVYDDIEKLTPIIKEFFAVVEDFSKKLYELKVENNCFTFADIEREVLNLLVKYENNTLVKTDIAKELSDKYYSVLVDEYQDTNDLQNTIFNALSDDGKKLFMVGDVKQSIYGFRKANPKNFLAFRNELPHYEEGSKNSKVIMSGNYRSSEEVCDFVNFLFYRLFSERCGEMYYEQEDMLVPKATYLDIDEKRVHVDIITEDNSETKSAEKQAYHIANIIREKIDNKPIITEDGALRKAKYSDVCILLRSRTEMPTFRKVFEELDIPVWIDDNDGLLEEKEIITLFSLLQVVDNPFADIPLLATLTGDIYNFSADEVALIRAHNRKKSLYNALLEESKNNEKVKAFLDEISEFKRVSVTSDVSSLISKILNKTGYENTVYLYANGENAYNNLLLFKEVAKSFEENSGRGLSAFVSYIKRQIKNKNYLQKAVFTSENDNSVRIMTMHRSKGLQFPICILACLDKSFNRKDSSADVILTEKCGIGLNYIDKNRHIKYSTFPRTASAIECNNASQSEELRVLYVAMTRAKDFLYMIGASKSAKEFIETAKEDLTAYKDNRFSSDIVINCNNFLKMIMLGVAVHSDDSKLEVNFIEEVDADETEIEEIEERPFDKEKFEKLCEILNYKYPYKDLNKIFVKQSASALAHKEFSSDYDFVRKPVFVINQRLSAAQKGTAMHKFMQYCDFKLASISIADEIERLKQNGKLTEQEAKSLTIENLKAFFDSEIGKKVISNDKVYKEQNFMVEVLADEVYNNLSKEFENEKIIIQGVADLCFIENDNLVIVDYKTDKVDETELISRYKTQLDIYALALSQVFDMNVSQTAIYSFYLKKLIKL